MHVAVCLCKCMSCMGECMWKPEEGTEFPGSGVTGEMYNVDAGK